MVVDVDDDDDDDDDGDEPVDADTARQLNMLARSRAAREALRRAERDVEVESISSDGEDDAGPARGGGGGGSEDAAASAAPPPVYGGARLEVRLRTEGDKGPPLVYPIREDEPFGSLFERYACDRGVDAFQCKFMFDGDVLGHGAKPRAVDMEDQDLIDVNAPPKGKKRPRPGAASPPPRAPRAKAASPGRAKAASPGKAASPPPARKAASPEAPAAIPREKVVLAFAAGAGKPKKFKVYNDDPFAKAFAGYARTVRGGPYAFSHAGAALKGDDTPAAVGIASGTGTIDVAPA